MALPLILMTGCEKNPSSGEESILGVWKVAGAQRVEPASDDFTEKEMSDLMDGINEGRDRYLEEAEIYYSFDAGGILKIYEIVDGETYEDSVPYIIKGNTFTFNVKAINFLDEEVDVELSMNYSVSGNTLTITSRYIYRTYEWADGGGTSGYSHTSAYFPDESWPEGTKSMTFRETTTFERYSGTFPPES